MPVDHSHIVPAMYLRQWADENGRVDMVLVEDGVTKRVGVRDAGVRGGGFYKRERPSGERSDDIETVSIQDIENRAAPVLKDLGTHWPLAGDDKLRVAMLAGLQLVRGPRSFEWYDNFTVENLERYREEGRFALKPGVDGSEEEIHRATLDTFSGSNERLMTMVRLTVKMASAVGSMNWSLVRFDAPVLATSDHPVAVWPPSAAGRPAQVTLVQEVGVCNVLEIRFPVSPTAAILMTWRAMKRLTASAASASLPTCRAALASGWNSRSKL